MEREGKGNLALSEVKRTMVMATRREERSKTTTCCTDIAIEEGSLVRDSTRPRLREEGEARKVAAFTFLISILQMQK